MDEHKENINAKDVNVKMSDTREDDKVGVSSMLSFMFWCEFQPDATNNVELSFFCVEASKLRWINTLQLY